MPPKANLRSTSTKRILQEHKEFTLDPSDEFVAHPLEEDLFEWHVTVRGSEGGIMRVVSLYHLRILLPPTYPLAAPDLIALTPSGRFETNRKICIDGITSFHEGSWRPIWGVRTAIVGMMSFWNQGGAEAVAGLGGLNYEGEMKRKLAKESVNYTCPTCQKSNSQIMQDHQITLREAKAAQEAKKASALGSGSVEKAEGSEGLRAGGVEKQQVDGVAVQSTEILGMSNSSAGPLIVAAPVTSSTTTTNAPSSSSTRPPVEMINTPFPTTPAPPPLTPLQSLLTSPLTHNAFLPAPLKLLFHLFQLLLIPSSLLAHRNLPASVNTLLFLDTAIWFISVIGIWLIGGKVLRLAGLVRRGRKVGKVGRILAEGGTALGAGVMEGLPRRNGGGRDHGGAGRTPTNVRAGLADGGGAPRAVHTGQPEVNPQAAGQGMEERVLDTHQGHGHGHGHGNEANIRQRTGEGVVGEGRGMRGGGVGVGGGGREEL